VGGKVFTELSDGITVQTFCILQGGAGWGMVRPEWGRENSWKGLVHIGTFRHGSFTWPLLALFGSIQGNFRDSSYLDPQPYYNISMSLARPLSVRDMFDESPCFLYPLNTRLHLAVQGYNCRSWIYVWVSWR